VRSFVSHVEEHTLRVFENRVLRRIFGPKRDKVKGEWRRLRNEELYVVYSPNIIWLDQIKKNETGRVRSTHKRQEKCIQYFGREI
jgi:hypothetical protein